MREFFYADFEDFCQLCQNFFRKKSKNDQPAKICSCEYFRFGPSTKINSNFKFTKNNLPYYWPRFQKGWLQKYSKYGYIWYKPFSSRKSIYSTAYVFLFLQWTYFKSFNKAKRKKRWWFWPSAKKNARKCFEIMLFPKINSLKISQIWRSAKICFRKISQKFNYESIFPRKLILLRYCYNRTKHNRSTCWFLFSFLARIEGFKARLQPIIS